MSVNPRELIQQDDIERAVEFELRVLGALTDDAQSFYRIEDFVSSDDFILKTHITWFECIKRRLERNEAVDIFVVADELDKSGQQQPRGTNWLVYIGDAVYNSPSSANIVHYAKAVAKLAHDRRSVMTGVSILETLGDKHTPHDDRLRTASNMLSSLELADSNKNLIGIDVALTRTIERMEEQYGKDDPIDFPYGFDHLDEMTQGAHPGDLIIVAGRPSMGKTAFALCVAESFLASGKAGLIVSMEMSAEQLAGRMVTSVGRIDAQRYRSGKLNDDDWGRITHALGKLHDYPLMIDESPAGSPSSIRRSARRMLATHGKLDFIVVDYLQMMSPDRQNGQNKRGDEISEISRQMKMIAKELGIPVIVLSQLNRNLEQRSNKRPVMSDLRESGAIEQDADLILFLYRDEVYNKDSQEKGMAEIIIGKQRNGPVGTTHAAFLGAYSRFENLSRDY